MKRRQSLRTKTAKDLQLAIRMESADERGICTCVTCGKRDHYKKMDAGHFIAGRRNSILFDERGIHVQCKYCNGFLEGNRLAYRDYMMEHYSIDVIDELRWNRDNKSVTYASSQLEEMRKSYKSRIKEQEKRLKMGLTTRQFDAQKDGLDKIVKEVEIEANRVFNDH